MHKVWLSFPHKLALPAAGFASRGLIFLTHLVLLAGMVIPYDGPIFAGIIAGTVLAVEALRRNPFARDALYFGVQRCTLFVLSSLTLQALLPLLPNSHSALWYWGFACFLLVPLGIHDCASAFRGNLGLFYLRLSPEVIR